MLVLVLRVCLAIALNLLLSSSIVLKHLNPPLQILVDLTFFQYCFVFTLSSGCWENVSASCFFPPFFDSPTLLIRQITDVCQSWVGVQATKLPCPEQMSIFRILNIFWPLKR